MGKMEVSKEVGNSKYDEQYGNVPVTWTFVKVVVLSNLLLSGKRVEQESMLFVAQAIRTHAMIPPSDIPWKDLLPFITAARYM